MGLPMMTVSELIEKLREFPADMPVTVTGFDEWGFDDLASFDVVDLKPVEPKSHGPAYERAEDVDGSEDGPPYKRIKSTGPAFKGLHLGR